MLIWNFQNVTIEASDDENDSDSDWIDVSHSEDEGNSKSFEAERIVDEIGEEEELDDEEESEDEEEGSEDDEKGSEVTDDEENNDNQEKNKPPLKKPVCII